MNQKVKMILSNLLIFLIMLTFFRVMNCTGKYGKDIWWVYNPFNQTLTVKGTGETYSYDGENNFTPLEDKFNINSLIIEEGVTAIGDYAFALKYNINSITLPESLESIGVGAFRDIDIEEILIPENVSHIGESAFEGCSLLQKVTVKGNVSTIEKNTFFDCFGLSEVYIPSSLTEIKSGAFANCFLFTDVYYEGSEKQWKELTENSAYTKKYWKKKNIHFIASDNSSLP